MDIPCFINCVYTPFNTILGGSALVTTLLAFLYYRHSRSYKSRVRSLYLTLGLIPLTLVFILGNLNCNSWMLCSSHIIRLFSQGILASLAFTSIVYYFYGSQICVFAVRGKRMDRKHFTEIYGILDELCAKMDVKDIELFYVESGRPRAFSIYGSKNIIFLSVGAFEILDKDELRAVLAHEIVHLKNKHPLIKFVSRFLGFSYIYGFSLSKDLEREHEIEANRMAEKLGSREALMTAISKFETT